MTNLETQFSQLINKRLARRRRLQRNLLMAWIFTIAFWQFQVWIYADDPKPVEVKEVAPVHQYVYRANMVSTWDGDTTRLNIKLGMGVAIENEPIRLYGIDAPERTGATKEAGLKARDALISKIKGKVIILRTIKDKKGKYGRYLGVLWVDGVNVNEWMVKNGYAEKREYR